MKYYKKSFSLIELIFAIVLVSIIISLVIPKDNMSKLDLAVDKVILYLKYTRYIAMLDNKYKIDDELWYRERYTLKFQKCSKKVGGLYYVVFSDINHKGSPNKSECLKDPITNKYLYSHYDCSASKDESKYILLTKEYGVTKIDISCNSTTTLGQISFDSTGKVYSKLGTKVSDIDKYELKEKCFIKMSDNLNNERTIVIEAKTGYIHKI